MEGDWSGLFWFAMQSPARRAAENSPGRSLRSADRAAGVLRSHQFHRGLRGCAGVKGVGTWQGAWCRRSPASNGPFRWHGLSGSAACWRFGPATLFSGTWRFSHPLPWRLRQPTGGLHPRTVRSPHACDASVAAPNFSSATLPNGMKTAMSLLPPIRTRGIMSGGPIADFRL